VKVLFAVIFLAMLFGFFTVFFRGRLSGGCAGASCAKREAGSCGCPPEEAEDPTPETHSH